jgi:hypothetical protein
LNSVHPTKNRCIVLLNCLVINYLRLKFVFFNGKMKKKKSTLIYNIARKVNKV